MQNHNIKPHNIIVGYRVLLNQKKTKFNHPYDPSPYHVTEIRGHQITAKQDHAVTTEHLKAAPVNDAD